MKLLTSEEKMASPDFHQCVIYHQITYYQLPVGGLFVLGLLCYQQWVEREISGTSSDVLSFSLWQQYFMEGGITVSLKERMIQILFSHLRNRIQMEVNCKRSTLS